MLQVDNIFIGQIVKVDGDEGVVVHIQECDFYTASVPSIHTQEKVFTVHFEDGSICEFRGQDDIDEY